MQDCLGNALHRFMNGLGLPVNDKLKVAVQAMSSYCEQFDGIIYYRELLEENYRIYMPENVREELLGLHHGGKWGGQFSECATGTIGRICAPISSITVTVAESVPHARGMDSLFQWRFRASTHQMSHGIVSTWTYLASAK